MREIIINSKTHGRHVVMVDDEDFDKLSKFKWYCKVKSNTIYSLTTINGRAVGMHRMIMGTPKNMVTDHKDGNGLNNCRSNLRVCTQSQNLMNKTSTNNKTGFKGISLKKDIPRTKPYYACVYVSGKKLSLGYYKTLIEAVKAYNNGAIKYYGEFANLNKESCAV